MNTITEDYCSFEVAKLLKDKGFLKGVDLRFTQNLSYYDSIGLHHNLNKYYNSLILDKIDFVVAPTLQMAMKWLRKNYQIFIRPNISFLYPIKWYSEIFCYGDNLKTQQDIKTEYYDSPEQACEAAIKYCLENLI